MRRPDPGPEDLNQSGSGKASDADWQRGRCQYSRTGVRRYALDWSAALRSGPESGDTLLHRENPSDLGKEYSDMSEGMGSKRT